MLAALYSDFFNPVWLLIPGAKELYHIGCGKIVLTTETGPGYELFLFFLSEHTGYRFYADELSNCSECTKS
jgi:hypothetical protein